MKRSLLTIFCSLVLFLSYAQVRKYPPLMKEDINLTELSAKYGKDAISENYLFYKMATVAPITVKNEIEENYLLKNYCLDKMFPDKSKEAVALSKVLFDTLRLRTPKADEAQNFIYYEAKIDEKLIPALLCGTINNNLKFSGSNVYQTAFYPNLLNMSIVLTSNLLDVNKRPVRLGETCIVTTSYDGATNLYRIIIAVELKDSFQKVVNSGDIVFSVRISEVKEVKIAKNDVGKNLSELPYTVLAFENGVIHLMYDKRYKSPVDIKLIGTINNNKFRINIRPVSLVLAVYGKYRDNPKLNFDKFTNQEIKRKINIDPTEFSYNVDIYHIGYDIDTLHFITPNSSHTSDFKYVAGVTKDENSDYSFRTIAQTKRVLMASKESNEFNNKLRDYVHHNVKYPAEAQENGISGAVVFHFEIAPDGEIVNVKFIESPDRSLSQAVLDVLRTAPKLKRTDYGKEDYNLKSTMRIEFRL